MQTEYKDKQLGKRFQTRYNLMFHGNGDIMGYFLPRFTVVTVRGYNEHGYALVSIQHAVDILHKTFKVNPEDLIDFYGADYEKKLIKDKRVISNPYYTRSA